MDKISNELSIIAYYLSQFDIDGVRALGYRTRAQAFSEISGLLGRPNQYLKLRRDEFDVLTDSKRKGWRNRPVAKDVQKMYDELKEVDFAALTVRVKEILSNAEMTAESDLHEQIEEKKYITQVNRLIVVQSGTKKLVEYPKPVATKTKRQGVIYVRDPQVAANALCNAGYKCEVCEAHETFVRKSTGLPYTEPHHLVPMKAQRQFNVSLDVENNIVSLCSTCHNKLHYGADIEGMLCELYRKRQDMLLHAGIKISFMELKDLY